MEIIKNVSADGLMDMKQTAAYLNIKKQTLYDMVMRRKIPVIKIGRLNRFRRLDLDIWIDKNAQ